MVDGLLTFKLDGKAIGVRSIYSLGGVDTGVLGSFSEPNGSGASPSASVPAAPQLRLAGRALPSPAGYARQACSLYLA